MPDLSRLDTVKTPKRPMWIVQEYLCACGARMESLERRSEVPETMSCGVCGADAGKCLSAVTYKQKLGVGRGGFSVQPLSEAPPGAVDTRYLARRAGVDV